jgi:hypothetical protein
VTLATVSAGRDTPNAGSRNRTMRLWARDPCGVESGRSRALPGGRPASGDRCAAREEEARGGTRGSPTSSKLDSGGAAQDARRLGRVLPVLRPCRAVLRGARGASADRLPAVLDDPRRPVPVVRRADPLRVPGRVRGLRRRASPERALRRRDPAPRALAHCRGSCGAEGDAFRDVPRRRRGSSRGIPPLRNSAWRARTWSRGSART